MKTYEERFEIVQKRISEKNIHKTIRLKRILTAVSLALVLAIGGAGYYTYARSNHLNIPDAPPESTPHENSAPAASNAGSDVIVKHVPKGSASQESGRVWKWDEMIDPQRYGALYFQDREYSSMLIAVSQKHLGEKRTTAKVQGFDIYTDTLHTKEVTVYTIIGIDPDAAVAVTFDDDKAYAYVDGWYRPKTLGDFITALDLTNNLSTGLVYQSEGADTLVYEDISREWILDMLFSDPTLVNLDEPTDLGQTIMSVGVRIDLLGNHTQVLNLTTNGYIWTNLLQSGKYFYVGPEKISAFVNEVSKHQAYLYVYDLPATAEEE